MRRLTPLIGLAFFVSACQDAAAPDPATVPGGPSLSVQASQGQGTDRVFPGRVLVQLAEGADLADVAQTHGLAVERAATRGPSILRGAVGNERALASRLGADPRVAFAEPDYLREHHTIDSRLWAFENPGGLNIYYTRGRNSGKAVPGYSSKLDADEDNSPEGYAAGGGNVVIGSIDTGVDFVHNEFLPGQLLAGKDWYDNDNDPSDQDGHGTHTTGTMVGRTVGVAGVAGAGSSVKVYVQRVCGPVGCPTSAIVSAIYAAADYPGMVAMNMSLGGGSLAQSESDAIAYALGKGVLVIASAGNGGTGTVSCPACDPNAISVAASDWFDEHAYYTNWGPGLDITAPGGELYSNTTEEAGIYSAYLGGGYAYLQGTSMAAPQVTGTAAIVASVTGLRGSDLRNRIEGTTDDLGAAGYDTQFGNGRLNSYQAVTGNGGGGTPPPPPPPPSLSASFSYSCGGNTTCLFDATGSTGAATYAWTFGDGASGTGIAPRHTYGGVGDFTVTLTVSDGASPTPKTASTSQVVSCTVKGKKTMCK